jgi:hypothetical protein
LGGEERGQRDGWCGVGLGNVFLERVKVIY